MTVLLERFPYRYVENGTLENGKPDFRIQKMDKYSPSCLLYTSPSPRDRTRSRMPSSA